MVNCEELLKKFTALDGVRLAALDKACGWSLNIAELRQAQVYFKKNKTRAGPRRT